MQKKILSMKLTPVFFILMFFLCVSIALANSDLSSNKISLNKRNNGNIIQAHKGDIVQIELQTLGSAGYNWYFDNLDPECFDLISHNTKKISDLVGAPVLGIWTLKIKKSGNCKVKMDNYRIWEGKKKVIDHFETSFAVK